jgi:phosphopentomutase
VISVHDRGRSYDRIAVVVCDSVGCGGAPDAAAFGDSGSNTLAHVIEAADPRLPHLASLGIDRIEGVPSLGSGTRPLAAHGRMVEKSAAKDTMTGHWELMGLVTETSFPTYPDGFPEALLKAMEAAIGRPTIGNRVASGTEIIKELGAEHMKSGAPIVYTSADSVFQVAAHEDVIPVPELYAICETARRLLVGEHGVGRVIARPFIGSDPADFQRTARRHDYALPPPAATVLDKLVAAGLSTFGIGKIHDIFAGRGLSGWQKTADNADGVEATCRALREKKGDLILTNLVDFDSAYGHRNDPQGYAAALEELDRRLPGLLAALGPRDCLMITADHGCDPTYPGTDHTRECVPLLAAGESIRAANLGTRQTFADLACTIAENFEVDPVGTGQSFLDEISG